MKCVEAGFSPGPGHADLPHPDQVVTVSGEQNLAIAGPGEDGALGRLGTSGPGLRSSNWFLLSMSHTLMEGPLAAHSQYLQKGKIVTLFTWFT